MKTTGIVIIMMITLSLVVQAEKNYADMKMGSNISPDELTCQAKCGINCVLANLFYPICFAICVAKCPKTLTDSYDCVTGCGVSKSITVNIDARGNVVDVVDSCLQKCEKS
ncbi:unnamed protein product [Sphenostylis stenocarpa]|uniref:Uncharacterized protein n=1 Tax=Sphenostylis stenocarpa TaxID=92480 RepID=A0AA86W6M1_9FABA|nr:unnamed protein product [Sphenostylis stenocarpa]